MTRTVARPLLVAVALAWAIALFGAAWVASQPAHGLSAYAASAAVYAIGSLVCHQLPNRSFHVFGAQLPVCARCAGLYVGAAAAALASARTDPVRLGRAWARARELLVVAAAPTAATLMYEWTSGSMPAHWIRAAAGFALGAIAMLVVLAAVTLERPVVEVH